MTPTEDNETLIERAAAGDREAFDRLVERFGDRLRSIVRSRCGERVRAQLEVDDLVQETFLRAFQAIGAFKWQGEESFLRWLVRIAEHLIWNASQKRPRGELLLEPGVRDSASGPEKGVRRHERFDRLERALSRLGAGQREAIRLSRIEGLKVAEIARRMERSPAAVKMLISRGLRELRANFGDTESLRLPDRRLELDGGDAGDE